MNEGLKFFKVILKHEPEFEETYHLPSEDAAIEAAISDWEVDRDNIISAVVTEITKEEYLAEGNTEEDIQHDLRIYGYESVRIRASY